MSGPTPADVFGPPTGLLAAPCEVTPQRHPAPFFAHQGGAPRVARQRAVTLRDAHRAVERLGRALAGLLGADEADLDLAIERYRRAADRADTALDAFDAALDDPDGPPAPVPHARSL